MQVTAANMHAEEVTFDIPCPWWDEDWDGLNRAIQRELVEAEEEPEDDGWLLYLEECNDPLYNSVLIPTPVSAFNDWEAAT